MTATGETFIYENILDDISICDEIIEFYKENNNKFPGRLMGRSIDLSFKDSIDCLLNDSPSLFQKYGNLLQKIVIEYIEKYPMCNFYSAWAITETINVQYYKPTAGFHAWHTERTTFIEPGTSRHLVFMTYLNDVEDEGETEFYHQGIKVKPKKGLTLIWPADWTHTHRGIASKTQEKYIVTGWFNFCSIS